LLRQKQELLIQFSLFFANFYWLSTQNCGTGKAGAGIRKAGALMLPDLSSFLASISFCILVSFLWLVYSTQLTTLHWKLLNAMFCFFCQQERNWSFLFFTQNSKLSGREIVEISSGDCSHENESHEKVTALIWTMRLEWGRIPKRNIMML
jgi:hypothetical protein